MRSAPKPLHLSRHHVLSIEHEDSLMTTGEGIAKADAFLHDILIREPKPSSMHWA